MYIASTLVLVFLSQSLAFPWVPGVAGVDSSLLKRASGHSRRANKCPNNPIHAGAVPFNAKYPYCGARGDTVPATFPCKNNLVPAKGDIAHKWIAPGPNDIRGPCPGINAAANHGFLSRDGITTYSELVEMQQNVYGISYDIANILATLGVGLGGDVITERLSIGCDATSRTGSLPGAQSGEFGLNGHNKFESDASLTRNDYFTNNYDDFSFNRTLFDEMITYCKGGCNAYNLAEFRYKRWSDSKNENGNFAWGPLSILLYGAATFLYELMPSAGSGIGDIPTLTSFFVDEKIPDNWFSRPDPYTLDKIAISTATMFLSHPVPFGYNQGKPNSFVGVGLGGLFTDGALGTPAGIKCVLYLLATQLIPTTLLQTQSANAVTQAWALKKLLPFYKASLSADSNLSGCPLNPHGPSNPNK